MSFGQAGLSESTHLVIRQEAQRCGEQARVPRSVLLSIAHGLVVVDYRIALLDHQSNQSHPISLTVRCIRGTRAILSRVVGSIVLLTTSLRDIGCIDRK